MPDRPHSVRFLPRLLVAGLAASALALTGCAGGSSSAGAESGGSIALTVATFGDSSAIKELVTQYEEENPGVAVKVNTVANVEDSRTNLLTKLAAGSGLADVEQLEIAWLGQLQRYTDRFVPLEPDEFGPFIAAQAEPVTLDDGNLWALGVGTGPSAICYREDLLAAAGMATDAASLEVMFSSWDSYFAAGEQYAAGGGVGKWYGDSYLIFNAQVEQLSNPYEAEDGEVVVDNPEVEQIFRNTLELAPQLSANISPFSEDWNTGFANGAYATVACPSWLLSTIEGNAPDVSDWRIANAFPGGNANLGGSFFSVPTQSKNPDAAAALAAWLTAPEQQVAAFKGGSAFPSREQALEDPELREVANDYFGGAEVGAIFADRLQASDTVMYKGPNYIAIDLAAFDAISRVETGGQSINDAWEQLVEESEAAAQ